MRGIGIGFAPICCRFKTISVSSIVAVAYFSWQIEKDKPTFLMVPCMHVFCVP